MSSIVTSSNLLDSINRLNSDHSLTIWAQDMSNKDSSRHWKRFITGHFRDIIMWNAKLITPNLYEELLENRPSRLYMDVEIEQHQSINYDNVEKNVNALNALNLNLLTAYPIEANKEVDEAFAADFQNLLIDRMDAFITEHLPAEYYSSKTIIMSACRKNKLSFHVLYPDLVFDRHNTSMVFFLWEFRHWFKDQILIELQNPNTPFLKTTLIRSLCLNSTPRGGFPSPIDRAPYGKTQQFRMFGCGKLGKAPLRIIREGGTIFPPQNFIWDFGRMWAELTSEEKSSIFVQLSVPMWLDKDYIHISPGNCNRSSALTAYRNYAQDKLCIFQGRRREQTDNQYRSSEIPPISNITSVLKENVTVGSTEDVLLTDYGTLVAIDDLEEGTAVFHDQCEVTDGVGIGDPSARICKKDPDFIFSYCFNCSKIISRYIKTWKFEPIYFEQDEILDLGDNYINDRRTELTHIDLDNLHVANPIKLVVIDAPTNAGKTTLLKTWLDKHPLKRVIFIYPTIAMCSLMAGPKMFNIPCYLDEDFDYDSIPNHFVICLNSLKNIKIIPKTYAIVLDEGGLTRYATCANTIVPYLKSVLTCMQGLFGNTQKVIICQHSLSQSDLDYYRNFFPAPVPDAHIFKRQFIRESKVLLFNCSI